MNEQEDNDLNKIAILANCGHFIKLSDSDILQLVKFMTYPRLGKIGDVRDTDIMNIVKNIRRTASGYKRSLEILDSITQPTKEEQVKPVKPVSRWNILKRFNLYLDSLISK